MNNETQICRLCLQPILPDDRVLDVNITNLREPSDADANMPKPLVHVTCVHKRTGLGAEPGFSVQEL